tara:strand:- start:17 stop:163 length:147 start_codon:yes stop_codon:yes gene_type:complete
MAVQQILGKKITKYDTKKLESNPNFIKPEKDEIEIVNGNLKENFEEDI